ncbi:MAG: NTP transferase domain-containing protein [Vicinamibacteria bacterium]|nr:NTP transferase domain-containing protein [Vicinamibacteria bacterium]
MPPRPAPTGALVLTAGLGTRLRPLTADRAKPALPVAGPTLVERILRGLSRQGVRRVLLNLHYRPETITSVVGDGSGLGVHVRYSWEVPLLGSGGGPRRAFSLVPDDRLWLVNGDTLTDVLLAAMAAEHAASDALVTMAVIPNPAPERYGGVAVTPQGEVTEFVPRGSASPTWHFVGVQIAERDAFASLADGVPADSVGPLYRALIASRPGAVRAFRSHARFVDIGTPRDYLDTCLSLAGTSLVAGARVEVDPSARLEACVLWDDVRIGRGVRLRRVVVGEGVHLPDGYQADNAVVVSGAGGPEVTQLARM